MSDVETKIKELIEIAKAATPGPYHIGHIDEYIPNIMDVENHECVIVAEDIDGKNARYLCAFHPAFVLKLIESWSEMHTALEFYGDKKVWHWSHAGFKTMHLNCDTDLEKMNPLRQPTTEIEIAGRRAREALAKADKVFE